MAKDDLKKEIIKKVLNMDNEKTNKEEQEKILDSELSEIAGGTERSTQKESDLSDTCKCGVALACS